MTVPPNRFATAAAPRPTAAATIAAHSAGTGWKVSVTAMISAVAATMPTIVMTSRTLLRRLAAACA